MKIRITVEFDTVEAPYDPKKAFEDFEEAQATYLDVIQEALSQECRNGPVKITVENLDAQNSRRCYGDVDGYVLLCCALWDNIPVR